MKKILLVFLLFTSAQGYAQQNEEAEKKEIVGKVNLFFKSLETKDTFLYKTLVYPNAQIWAIRPQQDTLNVTMRSFSDDFIRLATMKQVIEEKLLSSEIKIHNNIAVAWIPYTLSFSGKFSHCGVDVFTLLKTAEGWKIVSTVYSVEPDGCAALKQN